MSETKLENFTKAVARLNESVEDYKHYKGKEKLEDMSRDSLIKRFKLAFELSWKTLADFLESNSVKLEGAGPKGIISTAYRNRYLKDEEKWLNLLKTRNLLTHVYKEEMAKELAGLIVSNYAENLNEMLTVVAKRDESVAQ